MKSKEHEFPRWTVIEVLIQSSRMLLAWVFTGVYFLSFLVVYLLSFKQLPDSFVSWVIRTWGKAILRILGIQMELVNPSNVDTRLARVLIINHQSALDLAWTAAICPPGMIAIGKKEIIWVPVFNLMWWALDFIRIDRKNSQAAIRQLQGVAEKINKEKRSLFVSPEGTRTFDGQLLPFKKGAFHIATEGEIPIFPVVVSGAFELLPRWSFLPRSGKIRVRFLPPISTLGLRPNHFEPESAKHQELLADRTGHSFGYSKEYPKEYKEKLNALIQKVRDQMIEAMEAKSE